MTRKQLARIVTHREGKKHQATMGDVEEILKIIFTLEAEDTLNDVDPEDGVRGVFDRESSRILEKLRKKRKK